MDKFPAALGEYLHVSFQECDTDFFQKNRTEIEETAEKRRACLRILKRLLKEIPDYDPCLEDNFLLRFLRVTKFDCCRALRRICKYHAQQNRVVDALGECSMPLSKAASIRHVYCSPHRPHNNSTLVFIKAGIDYSTTTFEERFYLDLLAVEQVLVYPVNQICGITVIMDFEEFDYRGVIANTPGKIKLTLETFQSCIPVRITKCHLLNAGPIAFLFNLAFPMLSQKIRRRIQFHSRSDGYKSLHNEVPPDILPEKYDGHLKDSDMIYLEECHIKNLDKKFREYLKFGYTKHRQKRESFHVIY